MLNLQFERLVEFLRDKREILILTHDNGDADAFTSCVALSEFLTISLNKENVVAFSELSRPTKDLAEKFGKKFPNFELSCHDVQDINVRSFDVILVLDTNDLSQVQLHSDVSLEEISIPLVFIDHHYVEEGSMEESIHVMRDDFASTAEMIHEMFKTLHFEPSDPVKYLLISGILTDSGFFRYGDSKTVMRVAEILEGLPDDAYQEILKLLRSQIDVSEKIANVKGIKRAEIIRVGDWLIGKSKVSSFASSVASTMTRIGFDVGVVISRDKKEYKISTRANRDACLEKGLHLGKILNEVASEFGVDGGGHDGAAGLNGKEHSKKVMETIITKIKEILIKK